MRRKILALILALSCINMSAYAYESKATSNAYDYVERISGYGAEMYIDEGLSKEEIMKMGLSKLLEERPELVNEILKYGFSEIDKYSEFYSGQEFYDYITDINHTFYGIGVMIQQDGEYTTVISCIEGGSAAKAGIKEGDKIVKVDGENCVGLPIDDVQAMVTGELDSMVSVTVLREDKELTFEMKRCPVDDTTVSWAVLEGNVGLVKIINFAEKTASEFKDCLAELRKLGVKNIILDLRNNPGGYLQTAIDMGKMIVPKGVIIKAIYRQSENNQTYYSDLRKKEFDFTVLVNDRTASAAEVLSAAIQESGAGVLVGETTYGKALIQDMVPLTNGSAFKITTGKYLTRKGNDINKVGITPDIEIVNPQRIITTSRYPALEYKTSWIEGMTGAGVYAAKIRLFLLGYNVLNDSEKFDEELTEAVKEFQTDRGLEATGVLDRITQVQLENEFAKLKEEVDMQLILAYQRYGGTEEMLYGE